MSNFRTGLFGSYYGSYWGESAALDYTQMKMNASYIFSYLTNKGWTTNSIAALLGNMQVESTINPGRWQSDDVGNISMGYGLVQWTPSTKYTIWCDEIGYHDPSEMDTAIARILYELENGIQWIPTDAYSLTFQEFTKSTQTPAYLAKAFVVNYERPADQSAEHLAYRGTLATEWYRYLAGETPGGSGSTKKRKGFNFLLFNRRRRMFT